MGRVPGPVGDPLRDGGWVLLGVKGSGESCKGRDGLVIGELSLT